MKVEVRVSDTKWRSCVMVVLTVEAVWDTLALH
jgi:hypothetical protein